MILGGGGDVLVDGEMAEEGFDVRSAEITGVLAAVKGDEALDSGDVCVFGADRVLAGADQAANVMKEFWGVLGHGVGLTRCGRKGQAYGAEGQQRLVSSGRQATMG